MNLLKNYHLLLLLGGLLFITSCEKNQLNLTEDELAIDQLNLEASSDGVRNCGSDAHMAELMKDPAYKKAHQAKLARAKGLSGSTFRAECSKKVLIPVAVHYQRIKRGDINCLRAQAEDQIRILNEDYAGTNMDISLWTGGAASYFPEVSNGEACIEFCLATKNHPEGYGLAEGDLAVTLNETRGDRDANWEGYINIFVRSINYLGYSPLGGSGTGDGVVIDNNAFGSISCSGTEVRAVYNLGRTLTHELGHYLLLNHIWGGGCGKDDGIGDTPDSEGPYYGCPTNGVSTCGTVDMHMNYMDYVDDKCMYMFSAGQAFEMERYIANDLSEVVSNGAFVCGVGGPPPLGECVVPMEVSSLVNKKKVSFSWLAQPGATFDVQYRNEDSSAWNTISTGTNSASKNGMRNGTYEFQVRANCGTATGWSGSQNFTIS